MSVGPRDAPGEERRQLALSFLAERYTMALATAGPDGTWVASVFFASHVDDEGLWLYFLSSPESRHGRNLATDPRVAAAINEDEHDWQAIRGIQLEGCCTAVRGQRESLHAWRIYFGKFPFVRHLLQGKGGVAADMIEKLRGTQMYRLEVQRLFYLDNRRGFGNRQEVAVGTGLAGPSGV